ncbi:MAG TPA: universal stress protein [bacterium]|nr:universal stress protein [bacterium]
MTAAVQVSVLGTILAAAFAAALAALLLWMLRVPRPVSAEVARAVQSVGAVRTILVPILEAYYSERAVELASRLGQLQKASIRLSYIVEVPRTLSLGVPLPDVEEQATASLERAKQIVEMHDLHVEGEIVRAREAGEGIARAARDNDVDLIVMGISPGAGLLEGSTARAAESLLRQAPCEVIIDRLAETSIGATASPPDGDLAGEAGRGQEAPPRPV